MMRPLPRTDARRFLLVALTVMSPLLLVALLAGGAWAEWCVAAITLAFPVVLASLGAATAGAHRVLWALLLVLEAAGLAVLALAAAPPGGRVLGLPPATWVLLLGLGLVPLVLVTAGYARAFDRSGASRERG
jgi:hypothetical protein